MPKLVNRAKVATSTTGTGTLTLGPAADGYQSFTSAGLVNSDVVRYVIEDDINWEIGSGIYSSGTLTRSFSESSTGSLLNLSGGAFVFVTSAAEDLLQPSDIGATVQGYSSVLQGTTASYTTALDTKLAGVEAGATADQTPAEILAAIVTVDGAASGLDADLLDGNHASAFYLATNPSGYTSSVGTITGVTAGSAMTGGGNTGTVTISHADTSSQLSVNNSGTTYIQDVYLDSYGHVTSLTSGTLSLSSFGVTSTAAQLNYTSGVTSNIQTQLNGKAANTTQAISAWETGTGTSETIVSPAKIAAAIAAQASGPSINATASGSIANGNMVVVNADGTVSSVAEIGAPASSGAAAYVTGAFVASTTVYDITNNKTLFAGNSQYNPYYAGAAVGSVSGSSISVYGTPYPFPQESYSKVCAVYNPDLGRVTLFGSRSADGYVYGVTGTISGTSVTWGTTYVLYSAICYGDLNVSYDTVSNRAIVTIGLWASATSLAVNLTSTAFSSNGVATAFSGSARPYHTATSADIANGRILLCYERGTTGSIYAMAADVSSGTPVFGAEVLVTTAGGSVDSIGLTYDEVAQKHVLAFRRGTDLRHVVLTLSGSTISVGAVSTATSTIAGEVVATYHAASQQVVIAFVDSNTYYFTAVEGSIVGTTLLLGTPAVAATGSNFPQAISAAYDSGSQKIVYQLKDGAMYAFTYTPSQVVPNLTGTNFIGASSSSYTNGQTATIQTIGAIDDAQSGLTAGQHYYVQTDGSISTVAGVPSVFAGTAISATKLIIKG